MNFVKFTAGFVRQVFNDAGECIKQEFTAGDPVEYETINGDPIHLMDMPLGGQEYHPFDMVDPLYPKIVGTGIIDKCECCLGTDSVLLRDCSEAVYNYLPKGTEVSIILPQVDE